MKNSNITKIVGAGILTFGLTLGAIHPPTWAQTNTTTTTPRTTVDYDRYDRGFDWGWLGLLGLIGLAGLMRRRPDEPARYREPDEVSRTTGSTRY